MAAKAYGDGSRDKARTLSFASAGPPSPSGRRAVPVRKKSRRSPASTAWSKRVAGGGWGRARAAQGEPGDGAPAIDAATLDLTFDDEGPKGEEGGEVADMHTCACVVA